MKSNLLLHIASGILCIGMGIVIGHDIPSRKLFEKAVIQGALYTIEFEQCPSTWEQRKMWELRNVEWEWKGRPAIRAYWDSINTTTFPDGWRVIEKK